MVASWAPVNLDGWKILRKVTTYENFSLPDADGNGVLDLEEFRPLVEEVFGRDKPLFTSGSGPILADIGCTYHEQLRYPAELDVGVQITHIGSRSLQIATPVFRRGEDRAVADVRSILVWFDYEAQQATSVPQALHDRLQPLND